ncbi:hypothetical protein EVA_15005 [gut metagenome]|uniref:Uncharacterized protein n=1 Tax=gut metagenome TaxID=749906 RepID=J9G4Y9_9ZZZZ
MLSALTASSSSSLVYSNFSFSSRIGSSALYTARRRREQASSITSIALSGRFLSVIYLSLNLTAASIAA